MHSRYCLLLSSVLSGALSLVSAVVTAQGAAQSSQPKDNSAVAQDAISIENEYLKLVIGTDARNIQFIDKQTHTNYYDAKAGASLAHVRVGDKQYNASWVSRGDRGIKVIFGDSGICAVLKATIHKHHLVLEVLSLEGQGVDVFEFVDIPLTLKATPDEPFAACALALNVQTRVDPIPQAVSHLKALCYPRFGFAGAQVAIIGCPQGQLRAVLQEAVSAAEGLPKSNIGGPWALDAQINKGSYLFNFGGLSEKTVGDWIELANALGINQIDFHGGNSFRFGDCRPNPETYPNGFASLKAVIDRLHEAGIKAGLHTYAFFMAKDCPYITPVPDPRLGKDATFTLAEPLTPDATVVTVAEDTKNMSSTTGFFVRNSVTLQIDNELITYSGISKEPPYAFTNCQRGVCGTKATAHDKGAKVHHLKECFGLFCPDGDSTLLTEVAAKTAEVYNECGFDMIYLDALDGSDVLGGAENYWHYGSKFVYEICNRLKKPAVMEMSTFHHHLWVVRARMGAWDHPRRSHKRFIDIHCQANQSVRRSFLPAHLGWWAVMTFSGPQSEPTFADDIEYLCAKCIGNDVGFSVMGVDPGTLKAVPAYQRLAGIMKQYEELRHANYFDESVKVKLREPGQDFTLFTDNEGRWRFRRVLYAKHKVAGMHNWSNTWSVDNNFSEQPVKLQIEALYSAGSYDAPENITLAGFTDDADFSDRASAKGVTLAIRSTSDKVKNAKVSGVLTAMNSGQVEQKGAWTKAGKTFDPVMDLDKHQALGVWINGDGQGEILNFQLDCPDYVVAGIGEHYVMVDFTGWRYFELIEPEAERYSEYQWPYGGAYSIYREHVNYKHIQNLRLWYNNLPANKQVTCYLSPIKALPLVKTKIVNPTVTIGGKRIVFPVEMETGSYLEFNSSTDCKHYGPKGDLIGEVKPQGEVPILIGGVNNITFTCDGPTEVSARAKITVICQDDPI